MYNVDAKDKIFWSLTLMAAAGFSKILVTFLHHRRQIYVSCGELLMCVMTH
jgi:hypothetical protein